MQTSDTQVCPPEQAGPPLLVVPPQVHPEPVHASPAPQSTLQAPQSVVSSVRFASQPSVRSPLQLSKPALQLIEQLPALHDGVPWFELHTTPQSPQLLVLVAIFVSHPSREEASLGLQSFQPDEQLAIEHAPDEQAGVP